MERGDIYIVDLPQPSGGAGPEQAGSRPAVVVTDRSASALLPVIVPFTSQTDAKRFSHTITVNPSKQNGLTKESVLLVFQIRAIGKKRLVNRIGRLEDRYITQLNDELKSLLGL